MKILILMLTFISFSVFANDNEAYPNYYGDKTDHERLPYIDYNKLMESCMGKYPPIQGSGAFYALQKVCNKQLDQIAHPEMFEGKQPYPRQTYSTESLGEDVIRFFKGD